MVVTVRLRVPGAKTVQICVEHAPVLDPEDGRNVLHVIDNKTLAVSNNPTCKRYPYRFTPAFEAQRLKQSVTWVLGEAETANKSAKPCVFRSKDALVLFDGRGRKSAAEQSKLLKTGLKNVPQQDLPARKTEPFRVFYHNRGSIAFALD